jgi:hypothetical protein
LMLFLCVSPMGVVGTLEAEHENAANSRIVQTWHWFSKLLGPFASYSKYTIIGNRKDAILWDVRYKEVPCWVIRRRYHPILHNRETKTKQLPTHKNPKRAKTNDDESCF